MKTDIPRITPVVLSADDRGDFRKILDAKNMDKNEIGKFAALEMFTTTTKRFGVRGMHLQIKPRASRKLIWVTKGKILDVVVNVNHDDNFGEISVFELEEGLAQTLYVPQNYAHGFQSLTEGATVNYLVDASYEASYDVGFHPLSFGFVWPEKISVLSSRDNALPSLKDFRAK